MLVRNHVLKSRCNLIPSFIEGCTLADPYTHSFHHKIPQFNGGQTQSVYHTGVRILFYVLNCVATDIEEYDIYSGVGDLNV